MAWDTELVSTLDDIFTVDKDDPNARKNNYPDFAPCDADDKNGYVIWRKLDEVVFDYLDVRGYSNIVVALEIRANRRAQVQERTRQLVNALWQRGLLITVDTVEWRHYIDINPVQRGTYLAVVLRDFSNGRHIYPRQSDFYGDSMTWETELVKTFKRAKVQAWPDFAECTPDYTQGHVIWRQSDEVVDEFLDTAPETTIEIDLHFQARSRAKVQEIMSNVLRLMERRGQLIRKESAEWYYDSVQGVRGSLVTALIYPDPAVQPEGEFSIEFGPSFDVLQGEST